MSNIGSNSTVCLESMHIKPQYHLHATPEPVYRLAEKEWKDFVESFTDVLVDVDSQIPHLPPKDLIHRIYRDVSDFVPKMITMLTPS